MCAQWLRKVHLQVCPHEQLEDIIANGLRRARREKSIEGREGTGWGREGTGRCPVRQVKWKQPSDGAGVGRNEKTRGRRRGTGNRGQDTDRKT